MTATLLPDVPMVDYVRDNFAPAHPPSLSSSVANVLLTRSPRHAWHDHAALNPTWASEEDSRFDLGTAVHGVLLEDAADRIVALPFDDWRKKDAKTARERARAEGKVPLLAHQAETVRCMVASVEGALLRCSDLHGIGDREAERTILWQEGDAWCRCRPDWITADRRVVLSLKTTAASAEPDAFTRVLLGSGHDVQAAFESRAVEGLTGTAPTYVWIVVEVDPPYAVSFLGLSPALREFAASKFRRAVALWSECLARNEWPGYPDRVCYVEPPAWAMTQWMERWGMDAPVLDDGGPLATQLFGEA